MRASAPVLRRKCACEGSSAPCAACSAEHEDVLQRKSAGVVAPTEAPPIVHEVLASPGRPLDAANRAFMEPRFGRDFGRVRIHADSTAAESARTVGARAYTVGRDVAFAAHMYAPDSRDGRKLLAHELAHVVQQDGSARVLARQTVEQYETKGITLDVGEAGKWAGWSYWKRKVLQVYSLAPDPRMTSDPEERDAVLAALWQVRPATVTSTTVRVVTIPKRPTAAASKDIIYQITFTPRTKPADKDSVEADFVSEGAGATPVAAAPPAPGVTPQQPSSYFGSGFPNKNDIDKYWSAHPDEQQRVFNWIQTAPQTFDQVITTSVAKGTATQSASFQVKGTKDASGNVTGLTISFLGAVAPSTSAIPADYASHDFADLQIEEAQSKVDPTKPDKLGTINGLAAVPADEQLSAKFAIWQYFKGGTRNAEVDAIVPIANTARRVLYTFRFKPKSNDVDVQRIGEEGKDVSLAPQGDLSRVNGFSANSKDLSTLTAWLKKRYPGVTPTGTTVADVQKSVTAEIQANSGTPAWYKTNYGIEILGATAAQTRLQTAHNYKPPQLAKLKDFTAAELPVLELTLETMSDALVATFMGLQMARQETSIEAQGGTGGRPSRFVPKPDVAGTTLIDGSYRTIIIFKAASLNDAGLFLGGLGPSGKPSTEVETTMTFAHELGHTVANLPGVKKAFDDFVKAKKIKPVTWYAASNPPSELFPEAFALYQSDPEWLRQNWPDLSNWFDTLSTTGKPPPP
jgi:hypothetical protein